MTTRAFENAMCEIKERYIAEAINYSKATTTFPPKRRISIVLVAAIMALFLLGAGVVAVVYGESIQSWFAYEWQRMTGQTMSENHSAIIDHLSQDIAQSQTVNGVTVTLDSATVGENVLFLLVRVEAPELTDSRNCSFEHFDLEFSSDTLAVAEKIGGHSWSTEGVDQDGNPLLMIDQDYTARNGYENDISQLDVTLTLTDLSTVGLDEELDSSGKGD